MTPGLERIISAERFAPYLLAAGFDPKRALELYLWNMRVSAAFLPMICVSEVSVRNLTAHYIARVFGSDWWRDQPFHVLVGGKGKSIVLTTAENLANNARPVTHGRMTAALTFGFWVNMFLPRCEAALWTPLSDAFPEMPSDVDCRRLLTRLLHMQSLRNRIGHHEPIFQRNLMQDYADCLGLVRWMSAEKAAWIRPHCDVLRLMREKP